MKPTHIAIAAALGAAFALVALRMEPAYALGSPVARPLSWTETIATTATRIQAQNANGNDVSQVSYRCINLSTTPVYVGGPDVTTSTGTPYCTDSTNCPDGAAWGGDVTHEFGIVASSTQGIRCRGGSH